MAKNTKILFLTQLQKCCNDAMVHEMQWIQIGMKWCVIMSKQKAAATLRKSYATLRRLLCFHKFKRVPLFRKYDEQVAFALEIFTPFSTVVKRPYTRRRQKHLDSDLLMNEPML